MSTAMDAPVRSGSMRLTGVLLLSFASAAAGQDHSQHRAAPAQVQPEQHERHLEPAERERHEHRHAPAGPAKQSEATEAVDHAAMGHGAAPASDPHAGHAVTSTQAAQPSPGAGHEGMDHRAMGHAPPVATDAPREPIPELTDADRAAAFPPLDGHPTHDDRNVRFTQFNRLEAWDGEHGTGMAWEGSSWYGSDWNRLWLRSEGEREGGRTEAADLEVLYGRPVARWWDAVVGLRHDFRPGPSQTWLALGVMGLAPQWFEVQATAYLGESGQVAVRAEVEYELLLSNRLVLQPLLELELHSEDDPERGIGSGLGSAEAGVRLRYEFTRKFAPYVGVAWERAYGATADLRRAEGEDIDDTRLVAGVRFWF